MLRLILPAVCILALAAYFVISPDISVQTLLNHTPKNPAAAAAVILMLYIFKSITVFFPLIILEIAAGHLFSPWMALLINFMGVLTILTVPYWIGRAAGMDAV